MPGGKIVNPSGNTLATSQVALNSSTATLIVAAREGRKSVTLTQLGSVDVYVGNSSAVTTSTGDLLLGTKGTQKVIYSASAIWGISASATPSVSYSENYDS